MTSCHAADRTYLTPTAPPPPRWTSAQYWGVCHADLRLSNLPGSPAADSPPSVLVMTSRSERDDVIEALRSAGLRPVSASGAGYKLLQVSAPC